MKLRSIPHLFSWLLILLSAGAFPAFGQDEFANDYNPTLTYSETLDDRVVSDGFGGFMVVRDSLLRITAKASMTGIDPETITEETEFLLEFGALNLVFTLGDLEVVFEPARKRAVYTLYGFDPITSEEEVAGTVTITWTTTLVTFAIEIRNNPDVYQVIANDLALQNSFDTEFDDVVQASLTFAGRSLTLRNVYFTGEATYRTDPTERVSEDLVDLSVSGSFDSTPPANLRITDPAASVTVMTNSYTVRGSVSEERSNALVFLQVNDREPIEADMNVDGTWEVPNLTLDPGPNVLTATAVDDDGNLSKATKAVTLRYFIETDLTVQAAGNAPGQVKASFFETIVYTPGSPSPERFVDVADGEQITLTAVPGPGAVFAGWTANDEISTPNNPKLVTVMTPGLEITANFVQNPFLVTAGSFAGILGSDSPETRGFMSLKVSKAGSFTGKLKLGPATYTLKGKLLADGSTTFNVTKGGVTLAISLQLDGNTVTGSVTGPDLEATVQLDAFRFHSRTNPVAPALVGNYNVLLPAHVENTDANFPIGEGYGRLNVSKAGKLKFVGKLADGTAVTIGGVLSPDLEWPFFAALYSKRGHLSGRLFLLDEPNAPLDWVGDVNWFRPASTSRAYPDGFQGQLEFQGARYAWTTGRTFLDVADDAQDGQGTLFLVAPEAVLRNGTAVPAFEASENVTLDLQNKATFTSNEVTISSFKITPKTGLFSGKYFDPILNRNISFAGAILFKAGVTSIDPLPYRASGLFTRENVVGGLTIEGGELIQAER